MSKKDTPVKAFYTPNLPEPKGHYSQAVTFNDMLFVSGQLPVNPFSGEAVNGTIEEQAEQVLSNIDRLLKDAGSSRNKVVKVTVFISDISLWGRFNTIYSDFFGKHKPARSVVPVPELHYGVALEIELIASL